MASPYSVGGSGSGGYGRPTGIEALVKYKAGASSSSLSSSTALTNLTTKSDALGRVIPRTWGRVVVGGALVWASPFYIVTESLRTTTEYYAEISNPGDLSNENLQAVQDANRATTKITLNTSTDYGIDLCYSVGFDGEGGTRRKVFRVKLNGVLVYDALDGYVFPGIGFDIREHTDLDIPKAMQQYALTGKYFYPGQTLITFSQFRVKDWGGAIPQAVEVEFVTEGALGQSTIDKRQEDEVLTYTGAGSLFWTDFERRIQYVSYNNVGNGAPGLRLFNLDTGKFIEARPFTGINVSGKLAGFTNQGTWCGKLQAYVSTHNDFGYSGIFVDVANGLAVVGGCGTNGSCLGMACVSDSATKAETYTTTLNGFGQFVTLTRGTDGVLTASSAGGLDQPYNNWAADLVGHGDTACVIRNRVVRLIKPGGTMIACEDPPAEFDGMLASGCIPFQGGAVVEWSNGQKDGAVRYDAQGKVVLSRMYLPGIQVRRTNGGTVRVASPASERFYAESNLSPLKYLDLITLIPVNYPKPTQDEAPAWAGNVVDAGYDPVSNQVTFIIAGWTGRVGPVLKTAKVPLIEFIRGLYVAAGIYQGFQVTGAADIFDEITGAILVKDVDVNALVDGICDLYRLAKTVTNDGVYFYKTRSLTVGVIVKATIDSGELAYSEDTQENATAIQSRRNSDENTPSAITLRFIDENNEYQENSVTWRRVDVLNASGNEAQIALPIVMSPEQALYLVQQAVVDAGASTFTHEFRLPWKYACYLQPDDIIALVDGPYTIQCQIDTMDINGDLSASCSATSVGVVNVSDITAQLVQPTIPPVNGAVVEARGYVFDTPLLTPKDEPSDGQILMYYGIGPIGDGTFNGGYFGRKPQGGEFGSLPTILNRNNIAAYTCQGVLSDKRWTYDPDEMAVSRISGVGPKPKTLAELQAGALVNTAFYGKPGRWEIVRVCRIASGKAIGFLRGLRGTEVFAGLHEAGDLLVFAGEAVVHEARSPALIGTVEEWRPVSVGKGFASAASLPLVTVQGASRKPYAPGAVQGTRSAPGGPVALSWRRRDRLGTGWGADLPASDPVAFRVRLHSDGGDVVREWNVTAETVTYTVEEQTADGTTGSASLKISVAQMGANGPGFSEVVTINGL